MLVFTLFSDIQKSPQVSVLTDQVEAQGVMIHDLESSLMEHQHKLNCTEEMLQQVDVLTDFELYRFCFRQHFQKQVICVKLDQSQ